MYKLREPHAPSEYGTTPDAHRVTSHALGSADDVKIVKQLENAFILALVLA